MNSRIKDSSKSLRPRFARSYLFVPATRIDRIEMALASTADTVIVDLEDAVGEQHKARSRDDLANFKPSRDVHVRVNAVHTDHFERDLSLVEELPWVNGIIVPMVCSAKELSRLDDFARRRVAIIALVETARGVVAANEIALSGVSRLMFGSSDYAADLGTQPSAELFNHPRAKLVVVSAAAGIPAPVDGPTTDFRNIKQLRSDSYKARAIGMGGKLCIHPSQVSLVNSVFGPSMEDMRWAKRVLTEEARHGGGVFALDGKMVDEPVLARARGILQA